MLLLVGIVVLLTACGGGGSGGSSSEPVGVSQEPSTLFENAGILNTSGGTIQAVGAYINIPPNGLEGETHIVFESESPSSDWGETDVNAYKLISDTKILDAEIVVDNTFQGIEKALDLEIAYINTENGDIFYPNFTYSVDDGTIHIVLENSWELKPISQNIAQSKIQSNSLGNEMVKGLIVIKKKYIEKFQSGEVGSILMPYFGQFGGSCWAASSAMLALGLQSSSKSYYLTPLTLMHHMGVGADDGFLAISGNSAKLTKTIAHNIQYSWYAFRSSAKAKIVEELDAGHPMMYSGKIKGYTHQVLIVGYHYDAKGELYITKLDPQGLGDTRYMQQKWSELGGSMTTQLIYLFWSDQLPASDRALVTLHGFMSITDGGDSDSYIKFMGFGKDKIPGVIYEMEDDVSASGGYAWSDKRTSNKITNFANNTQLVTFNYIINNTDDTSQNVDIGTSVTCGKNNTIYFDKNYDLDAKSSRAPVSPPYYLSLAPLINKLTKQTECHIAFDVNHLNASRRSFGKFTLQPLAEPKISWKGTSYIKIVTLTQQDDMDIYYTLDGSEVTNENGLLYSQPFDVDTSSNEVTVKFRTVYIPTNSKYASYIEPLYSQMKESVIPATVGDKETEIPTIPTLEWDNYPQPQWCPLIAKVNNDGDCPWIEKNINLDDGSNIAVHCIYNNTYRSTECVGDDKCTLIIERPYLDLTDDDYYASSLLHGWWKEYSVDEQWDNNTLSIYLTSANRYYMHEYKETKVGTGRVWDCK